MLRVAPHGSLTSFRTTPIVSWLLTPTRIHHVGLSGLGQPVKLHQQQVKRILDRELWCSKLPQRDSHSPASFLEACLYLLLKEAYNKTTVRKLGNTKFINKVVMKFTLLCIKSNEWMVSLSPPTGQCFDSFYCFKESLLTVEKKKNSFRKSQALPQPIRIRLCVMQFSFCPSRAAKKWELRGDRKICRGKKSKDTPLFGGQKFVCLPLFHWTFLSVFHLLLLLLPLPLFTQTPYHPSSFIAHPPCSFSSELLILVPLFPLQANYCDPKGEGGVRFQDYTRLPSPQFLIA